MLTVIMAISKVNGKLLFGDTVGNLPWGKVEEDMRLFKELTHSTEDKLFICSRSTYETLPIVVIARLNPTIVEEYSEARFNVNESLYEEVIVLGGRKLIDSCLPYADNIIISEISGIPEIKDSFIYLRDTTVDKLAQLENETTCYYYHVSKTQDKTRPYLKQAYCLTRD